ncbi:hypothetical protein LIER_01141 [Lithospermum erythrorhizon]|uniref:Uncharacterized protein n=1 Tax=Lithospermum erythrorhizon TaxID=34254 RepID=A0AAV3NJX2_LITER
MPCSLPVQPVSHNPCISSPVRVAAPPPLHPHPTCAPAKTPNPSPLPHAHDNPTSPVPFPFSYDPPDHNVSPIHSPIQPSPTHPTAPSPVSSTQPHTTRNPLNTHSMRLRPHRKPSLKKLTSHPHALMISASETEPTCFTQANKCPLWRQVMGEEITMLRTQTWTLVPPDPSMNVVGCR